MDTIHSFLQNQDFNHKDIAVYLDVYQHGQSFASTIALRTKLDRTTVYAVLKRLVARGVIAQTKIDNVSAYIPVSPEIFLNKIESRKLALDSQEKQTKQFINELKNLQKFAYDKPQIQIYEGESAVISLYEETVKKAGEQRAFLTLSNVPPKVEQYLKNGFIEHKLRSKVTSKVLVADSPTASSYKKLDQKSNRETKIVRNHPFEIHSEIILFGNAKVAIVDFHTQAYGIVIESDTLYKTMSTLFETIWQAS